MINLQKVKTERRREAFEKILESCYKKMENCVKVTRNANSLFFEVPEVMMGYPLYDLNECVSYVIDFLKSKGFTVTYTFPKLLYISWETHVKSQPKLGLSSSSPFNVMNSNNANGNNGNNTNKKITTRKPAASKKAPVAAGKFILDLHWLLFFFIFFVSFSKERQTTTGSESLSIRIPSPDSFVPRQSRILPFVQMSKSPHRSPRLL